MDYIIDVARRDAVLDSILDRYRRGGYPYNLKRSMLAVLKMPEKLTRGGEAEARFWLFSCMLMRGGINTDTALTAMSRMYDREMTRTGKRPFEPRRAKNLSIDELTGLLQETGTGLYRIARDWIAVAAIVTEQYEGRVMELVSALHNYDTAAGLLVNRNGQGLPGFQYKMVSMFLFFLTEAGLMEYFPYPPPVDFHLQRVAAETLIITRKDGSERLAYNKREHETLQAVLREMYLDYIVLRGIRSNELADAVWLLSRMMCRWNPGNKSSVGERVGRQTPISIHQADFSKKSDKRKYERSCGRCPVEDLCERNVCSNPYYVQGLLGTFGPRLRPEYPQLSLLPD